MTQLFAQSSEPPEIGVSQPMKVAPLGQSQPGQVDFGNYFGTPSGIALLAAGAALCLILMKKPKKKGILARGEVADTKHRAAARKKALELMQRRKHNEVGLYIKSPEGASFTRKGKKWLVNLPEDPKTIYIPNVEAGTAAAGATGSGKSYSFINPLVRSSMDQGFPVIYFDYKYTADNPSPSAQIAGYAEERGYEVSVFAPGLPESCVCNPLDLLRDAKDAETALQFALVLHKNFTPNSSESNPFFTQTAQKMIQGLLMVAKYSCFQDLMMCRAIARTPNLPEIIDKSQLPELIKLVFDSLVASGGAPETFSGIQATVANMLGNLMTPNILPALCGTTNMPLDLDGRRLLIFAVDGDRRDVVLPMIATILHLVVNRNVMRPRKDPLILTLDEIPAIFLPALDDWLNQNRSAGLCTILGFQSMDMLEKLYGRTGAGRLVGGCTTQAIFQLNDLPTAKNYSEFLGKQDVTYKQNSKSLNKKGGGGSSTSADHRQTNLILEPNEIATFPQGKAVILNRGYTDGKAVRVPLIEQIQIPKRDIDAVDESVKKWPQIRQRLINQSNHKLPTDADLKRRSLEVLDLLKPEPSPAEAAADADRRQRDAKVFSQIEDALDLAPTADLPSALTY